MGHGSRPACGAADEVHPSDQPQDGQGARLDDPACDAYAGG